MYVDEASDQTLDLQLSDPLKDFLVFNLNKWGQLTPFSKGKGKFLPIMFFDSLI